MTFIAAADTDIGISKKTNQDSAIIKHARCNGKEVLMAIVCDGMGGLEKGELASATVIRAFDKWFNEVLPAELVSPDLNVIGGKWALMLKSLNSDIGVYGSAHKVSLGTTFSGILFLDDDYVIAHVGDSRIYALDTALTQLTTDHTFIAREIARGNMTPEQAKVDKRRNLLLQCVGASENVEPQIIVGKVRRGAYMICSDGFRHEISEREIFESLNPVNLINKEAMHSNMRYLIEQDKARNEKDNITVVLIKVE